MSGDTISFLKGMIYNHLCQIYIIIFGRIYCRWSQVDSSALPRSTVIAVTNVVNFLNLCTLVKVSDSATWSVCVWRIQLSIICSDQPHSPSQLFLPLLFSLSFWPGSFVTQKTDLVFYWKRIMGNTISNIINFIYCDRRAAMSDNWSVYLHVHLWLTCSFYFPGCTLWLRQPIPLPHPTVASSPLAWAVQASPSRASGCSWGEEGQLQRVTTTPLRHLNKDTDTQTHTTAHAIMHNTLCSPRVHTNLPHGHTARYSTHCKHAALSVPGGHCHTHTHAVTQ